ncbi:MAG: hypothetical protein OXE81_00615 [Gammaproteobacteria bacterium]|nr:hypothetical protein [Gammaproteobacteria bacterium]
MRRCRLIFCLLALLPCGASASDALSARQIIERAHAAAGGEAWTRPTSLYLVGTSTFFDGTAETRYDQHEMWRVYPSQKRAAHAADGMVRIRSASNGVVAFDLAFDGETTWMNGKASKEPADSRRWASNFGFGVIRHALDEGYSLTRLPDDSVDAAPSFMVQVRDPTGGETLFGIAKTGYEILMVGFETPRGWHQRVYSEFYSKPDSTWRQPGLVRLFYNGVKQNEVRWRDFRVGERIEPGVFRVGVTDIGDK